MTPEPLLAPFTDKGKEVSLGFCLELIPELKTNNRWNNSGPTGTGFVTGAAGIGHTACGHLKVSAKRAVTIAWLKDRLHRRWRPGFKTETVGLSRGFVAPEERLGGNRGVGWGVRLEWVRWEEGLGLETGSLLCLGRDPGAPEGAKWASEKDCPGFG